MNIKNSYLSLPNIMYSKIEPRDTTQDELYLMNNELAIELGMDPHYLNSAEGIQFLGGGTKIDGAPFAQAYAGHQYGHFTMLGDGRAMMIGEYQHLNQTFDLHLKGSGSTPYSRRGDGNATLKSVLREHLVSDAMYHLGVPTTRSLAVLKTNQQVLREQVNQGAILVRSAQSHIRIGTFEYASRLENPTVVKELADYTINRHYPQFKNDQEKYLLFFRGVVNNQAKLIAKWQSLGFVHGVLNTDNVLVSGETIDYGPCAFLDHYDPNISFSSIDRNGRYSYFRQPFITSWNLSKLAQSLVSLIDVDVQKAVQKLNQELMTFEVKYNEYYLIEMTKKLGIVQPNNDDIKLVGELLEMMNNAQADFTNTFATLTKGDFTALPFTMVERTLWIEKWLNRILQEGTLLEAQERMRKVNPVIIPRNHMVEEALIQAAFEQNDTLYRQLLEYLQDPYNYEKDYPKELVSPPESKEPFVTYCGT